MIYFLSLLFACLGGACYAVCWKLQFHYNTSLFASLSNQEFWNPSMSWLNKWEEWGFEDGRDVRIERFWGSSRWFVFLTDAFHLFQFFALWLFAASAAVLIADNLLQFFGFLVALRIAVSGTFTLFFDVILKKR